MVRIKHRYLLVNILYPDSKPSTSNASGTLKDDTPYSVQFRQPSSDFVTVKLLGRVIKDGVADLFGDYGSGKIASSLQIKYFSPATSTAIIRVSRDHYRLVWTALTYVTRLPRPVDQRCVIQVVRVSGTIRKAEEEAIRRARVSICRARKAAAMSRKSISGIEADHTRVTMLDDGNDDDDFGMENGIEDDDGAVEDGSLEEEAERPRRPG